MLIGVNYLDSSSRLERLVELSLDCIDNEQLILNQRSLSYTYIVDPSQIPDKKGLQINDMIFYFNLDILYKIDNGNIILMHRSDILSYSAFLYMLFVMLVFHMHVIHIVKSLNNDNKSKHLLRVQGSEAKLSSKNLSLLAENIHHELKTPLVIIINKIEHIREIMNDKSNISLQNSNLNNISEDVNMIETHIDVIYNLLDRMKNYKNIKKTTTNKTIYEVINVSFNTMELFSKTKFSYIIDPKLRNYTVASSLTNEDIMNVFMNHIKNSLEAHTTKLEVYMHIYQKNVVYLQLIDNGDGIPNHAKEKIFTPDFSTKDINKDENEQRGIGLYLSKITLQNNGGDDFLIDTSDDGTSFGINIPAMRR